MAKTSARIDIFADAPCDALASYLASYLASHLGGCLADASVKGVIRHVPRSFERDDLSDETHGKLAFAYLDRPSPELLAWLDDTHLPYCVIDDLANSQFTTPALIDRSPVTIAIGTEGTAPVLARRLKAEIEDRLSPALGQLAATAGTFRGRVSQALRPSEQRHFWGRFFNRLDYQGHDVPGQIMAHAESLIAQSQLDSHTDEVSHSDQAALPKVMIVGAGPGDPALLTVQARNLLHKADIILHDRLVSSQILELCRREAEFIDVGKAAYRPSPHDGRGFSLARALREVGFSGLITARGRVIADQYRHLRQCGFDGVLLTAQQAAHAGMPLDGTGAADQPVLSGSDFRQKWHQNTDDVAISHRR